MVLEFFKVTAYSKVKGKQEHKRRSPAGDTAIVPQLDAADPMPQTVWPSSMWVAGLRNRYKVPEGKEDCSGVSGYTGSVY